MWHKVTDRLPDKNTRYAKKYGVPVLLYDENEHRAEPEIGVYLWHEGFKEYAEDIFVPSNPTHWQELPKKP